MMPNLLSPFLYIKRGSSGGGTNTTCALAAVLGSGLGTFPVNVPAGQTRWFSHTGPVSVTYTATGPVLSIWSSNCLSLLFGPSNPVVYTGPPAANIRLKVDNSAGGAAVTSITVS